MKFFAQHGFAQGDKTNMGLSEGFLDGVIYSPRDIGADRLRHQLAHIRTEYPQAELYFDPQYYAAFNVEHPEARLGQLEGCEEYASFFRRRQRRQLEAGGAPLETDIRDCLAFQEQLLVNGVISPNIIIRRSFDSIDAAISKNFIRQAGALHRQARCAKPLYVTLAVSRDTLLDRTELFAFLEDITVLEFPPRGFYILVAARSQEARADIFHADVIAGWLLINHCLAINGFEVINGYSDLLSPFLGAVGGSAGASGWWNNLRVFSLDRFLPAGGGRRPVQRYLSKVLISRIRFDELAALVQLRGREMPIPDVLNRMPTDCGYSLAEGFEPAPLAEVLQSWEALKSLTDDLCTGDVIDALDRCRNAVASAQAAFEEIRATFGTLDPKSAGDHLSAIAEGLRQFGEMAEIGSVEAEPR